MLGSGDEDEENEYGQSALNSHSQQSSGRNTATKELSSDPSDTEQLLAHCTSELLQAHDRAIVETVMRDVVQRDLGVTFEDIASLHTAKRLLNEAIVLPLIMPEFFTGIREPWKVQIITSQYISIATFV